MSGRLVSPLWAISLTFLCGNVEGGEKRSEAENALRTDYNGDPLPPGAVARLGTMRLRHKSRIGALAFSPDGKILASGGSRIRLWDPSTGKQLRVIEGKEIQGVGLLRFSPDGKTLISLNDFQFLFHAGSHRAGEEIPFTKIHLWDIATGKHQLTFAGHESYVTSAAFSPDGKFLASVGADDTIRLWDPKTGKTIRVIKQKVGDFPQIFVTPDGKSLVTGGGDGIIRLWDVGTAKQIRTIKAPGRFSIHLSPDGKLAASGGAGEGKIHLWDLDSGKQLGECPDPGHNSFWCFGPDGESLFYSEYDQRRSDYQLYLWNWKSGRRIRQLEGKPYHPSAVAFSPGGQTLALTEWESIRLWNISTGKEITSPARHLAWIQSLAVSPNGRTVATGSDDRTLRLWELPSGKPLQVWDGRQGQVASVAFSPDGRSLASGGSQLVRLWNVQSAKIIATFTGETDDWFLRLGFSPDGRTIAAASWMGRVYRWDVKTGKELKRLDVQSKTVVTPASFFLGVKNLASVPMEGANRIYNLDNGTPIPRHKDSEIEFSEGRLSASVFSPGGNLLATAGFNGIYLRETDTKQIIDSVAPTTPIYSMTFSPDGRFTATGYDNGKIILWDLLRCKKIHDFHGHTSRVTGLAFTPDGKYLVTGSHDGTALVWMVPDDVRRPRQGGKAPTDAELESLQSDLAGTDARKAYLAIESLTAAPAKSVPLLRRRLRPAAAMDAKRVPRLIEALDSDRFAVREAAMRELAELGDRADALLRSTLADKPALEVRRRIESLLVDIETETLYALRALVALERCATPEARRLLQELNQGDAAAWQTRAARAALERMDRRTPTQDSVTRPRCSSTIPK